MFIGWLREGFETLLEPLEEQVGLIDKDLVVTSHAMYPNLSFGAYENETLKGLITGYPFSHSTLINNFYYPKESHEMQERLLATLLQSIESDSVQVMASEEEKELFLAFGFEAYAVFHRYLFDTKAVSFNFSNNHAKEVNRNNYFEVVKKIDQGTFNEDRLEYVTQRLIHTTSLKLATNNAYQHSFLVSKKILKISPWIVDNEAFMDAEKLIRAVIYYRGLKKIFAYVPEIEEIERLYQSYKFEKSGRYFLLYKGEKPQFNLENIYAF